MNRAALPAVLVGVLGSAGWIILAGTGAQTMPSYLAAWLFWMAVPLGALPLVLAIEGFSAPDWAMLPLLRRCLLLLPLGALLGIPMLMRATPLFRRPDLADALPASWMAPGFFTVRAIVILVTLALAALYFARPPRRGPRFGLVVLALLLYVILVSVAAVDWVMALQPGMASSATGLLLIASQLGTASCMAAFLLAVTSKGALPKGLGLLLACLLAAWAFLHFTQYLIIWSANLPKEIVWYQARNTGFGAGIVWFAVAACLIAACILPSGLSRTPTVLASLAAMLLLVHLVEMLWLVTPAFRGSFSISLADVLAMCGIGGLLNGALLFTEALTAALGGRRHAPA